MPQLNPEFFLAQIFWLAIIFSSLYFFVAYYFIPRIGTVVHKRESSVKRYLNEAKRVVAEQDEIKKKIQQIFDEARNEAAELKRLTTKDAELNMNKEVAKVEREMMKKIIDAEERLARFKSKLIQDIEGTADVVAEQILAKIFETQNLKKKKIAN